MTDTRKHSGSPAEGDRREFLRRFGLTAAGLTLGPYVAPAVASFRPPAALVASAALSFFQIEAQPVAADGPAAVFPAIYEFGLGSGSFSGAVRVHAEPATASSGWKLTTQPATIPMQPGGEAVVRVTARAHGAAPASPANMNVRVVARAQPSDGSPSWVLASTMVPVQAVASALNFVSGPPAPPAFIEATAATFVILDCQWIDSRTVGPVQLGVENVPDGWTVELDKSKYHVDMNGQTTIAIQVRKRFAGAPDSGGFKVVAQVMGLPVQLKASMPVTIQSL